MTMLIMTESTYKMRPIGQQGIRLLIFAGGGIGGTEKCASVFAELLHKRGYEVGFVSTLGPRIRALSDLGIQIITPESDPRLLADKILAFNPVVIHQHVPGYAFDNILYKALDLLLENNIKLLETNVFGRLEDRVGWKKVDYRFFVSSASGTQAFRRAKLKVDDQILKKHSVLNYPVYLAGNESNLSKSQIIRKELGVSDGEVLFFRIGQPGKKWELWEFEAFRKIKSEVPYARLLLMEPPKNLIEKIELEAEKLGIILRKVTTDFNWLEDLNRAGDIALHASAWGESFGYTIAEAMSAGKPVITLSTPWGDNAQVELVENRKTGFVCISVGEMARRGIELARSLKQRTKMGKAGVERIAAISDPERETDLLEAAIHSVLGDRSNSLLEGRRIAFKNFAKNFQKREFTFSESLKEYPLEKSAALLFMIYKCCRAYLRNLKARILNK